MPAPVRSSVLPPPAAATPPPAVGIVECWLVAVAGARRRRDCDVGDEVDVRKRSRASTAPAVDAAVHGMILGAGSGSV